MYTLCVGDAVKVIETGEKAVVVEVRKNAIRIKKDKPNQLVIWYAPEELIKIKEGGNV
jgi:sRNA-binding protein